MRKNENEWWRWNLVITTTIVEGVCSEKDLKLIGRVSKSRDGIMELMINEFEPRGRLGDEGINGASQRIELFTEFEVNEFFR